MTAPIIPAHKQSIKDERRQRDDISAVNISNKCVCLYTISQTKAKTIIGIGSTQKLDRETIWL